MTAVEFCLPTLPPSKNALRIRTKRGVARSKKYREWLELFGDDVMVQRAQYRIKGPYKLTVQAIRPDNQRRDLANILESLSDALHIYHVTDDDSYAEFISLRWVTGGAGVNVRVETVGVE